MTNDTSPRDNIGAIPIAGDLAQKNPPMPAGKTLRQGPGKVPPARPVKPKHRRRWRRFLAIALPIALLLYTIAGYVLVPHLFHKVLPELLSRQTGRSIAIGRASFNPFTLSLTLRNTIVGPDPNGPDDQADPILSCGWLDVYFKATSLLNLQLNVERLNINDLFLHVQRHADSTINLAGLLPARAPDETVSYSFAAIPMPFSLANVSINNSRVLFEDRKNEQSYTIEQMQLAVPYLANQRVDQGLFDRIVGYLTSRTNSNTQFIRPEFSAKINGSPIQLVGETQLTEDGTETSLRLALQALNLANFWGALPVGDLLVMDKGTADLDLRLIFTTSRNEPPTLRLQGTAQLHDLWLRNQQGQEVAKLPQATLTGSVSPMTGDYRFSELVLEQPNLHIERDPNGNWFPTIGKTDQPATDNKIFEVQRLKVIDGRVSVVDRKVTGGFAITWSDIQCTADALSNSRQKSGKFALTARTGQRGGLSLQGDLALSPMTATARLVLKDFDLQILSPYVAMSDGFSIRGGRLENLEAEFNWQQGQGESSTLSFANARLQGRGLALDRQGQPIIELPEFSLTKGLLLVPEKQLDFGELVASRARLLLEWNADGALSSGLPLLGKDSGWLTKVAAVNVREARIMLRNADPAAPLDLTINVVTLTAAGLGQPAVPGTITALAQLQGGGSINLDGPLTLTPWSATLNCRLDSLPMSDLQPLLGGWLVPEITAGTLIAEGTLRLPAWGFSGSVMVQDFAAGVNGTEILSWRQASAKDFQLTLWPFALHIQDLPLQAPFLAWSVTEDSPALRHFIKQDKSPAPEALRIDHITFKDATLRYYDRTATPPFTMILTDLTGNVDDLAYQPGNQARITLEGRIAEASGPREKTRRDDGKPTPSMTLSGLAGFFAASPFFDLHLHAVGVKLPPLSPYLEPDLGYHIMGGNLELTSTFHLEQESVTGDNSLTITDFKLGDPIASPSRLPLTVALLTDTKGLITTEIPIAGKMDNPAFSIRKSLLHGVRNLLIRTTASPFTMVTSILPDQTVPDHVLFPHGSSTLSPENEKILRDLAELLRKRPRLRLTIKGFADAIGDQEALMAQNKTEQLKKQLAQETRQAEQLPAAYGKEEILTLDDGTVITEELLPAQEDSLVVDDKALATLARQRAAEVRRFFRETIGLENERLGEADDPGLVQKDGLGRSGNRVQFSLDSMTP